MSRLVLGLLGAVAVAFAAARFVSSARARRIDRRRQADREDEHGESLAEVFARLPMPGRGHAIILDDNVDGWVHRWRLISDARRTIDVATYLLAADEFGLAFLGLLLRKQREGVRVRLLVDALGSLRAAKPPLTKALLQPLVAAGADVRIYNKVEEERFARLLGRGNVLSALACDHDKLLIVDERVGVTGGRNVGREYFGDHDDRPESFFDKEVVLDGAGAVEGLLQAFERERSEKATHKSHHAGDVSSQSARLDHAATAMQRLLAGEEASAREETSAPGLRALNPALHGALHRSPPAPLLIESRIINSCSEVQSEDSRLNQVLIRLLAATQHVVWIESPYVILTKRALLALEHASRRGVKIVLLTNSPRSSDNALSQAVFMKQWVALKKHIPTLRIFVGTSSHNEHTKAAVFDEDVALVGSYNLDIISAGLNSELAVAMRGPGIARAVIGRMRERIAAKRDTVEYVVEYDERGDPRVVVGPGDRIPTRTRFLAPMAALLLRLPRVARV